MNIILSFTSGLAFLYTSQEENKRTKAKTKAKKICMSICGIIFSKYVYSCN